jgi:hypothetical protein
VNANDVSGSIADTSFAFTDSRLDRKIRRARIPQSRASLPVCNAASGRPTISKKKFGSCEPSVRDRNQSMQETLSEKRNDSPLELACRAGHPLCATVTLLLTIASHDSVTVHDDPDYDVAVFCDSEGACAVGVDPGIELRAKSLLASFPNALPKNVEIRVCSGCGCTDYATCEGGCSWIGTHRCSACEEKRKSEAIKPCAICQSIPHERACPNLAQSC